MLADAAPNNIANAEEIAVRRDRRVACHSPFSALKVYITSILSFKNEGTLAPGVPWLPSDRTLTSASPGSNLIYVQDRPAAPAADNGETIMPRNTAATPVCGEIYRQFHREAR